MATPSENARKRARAVKSAYDGPVTVSTPNGEVQIESLDVTEDGTRSRVEVVVSGAEGGDPNFVIVNPPTLVPDPAGDVAVRGQLYREDPIAAVAYVIAEHGGATAKQKDTRRGRR
jgi:hypothetical protein